MPQVKLPSAETQSTFHISQKDNIDVYMMTADLKKRCQWRVQQLLYSEAWVVIIVLSMILTNKQNGGEPEPTHKQGRNLHNHWRVRKVVWIPSAAADWRRDFQKMNANDFTWVTRPGQWNKWKYDGPQEALFNYCPNCTKGRLRTVPEVR